MGFAGVGTTHVRGRCPLSQNKRNERDGPPGNCARQEHVAQMVRTEPQHALDQSPALSPSSFSAPIWSTDPKTVQPFLRLNEFRLRWLRRRLRRSHRKSEVA